MTGIIVTMGPATNNAEMLTKLYNEGVRILRFNFPHYNINSAQKDLEMIRKAEKKLGKKFELLLDTEGPQIRTGVLQYPISYKAGERFRIVVKEDKRGDRDLLCDYPPIIKDIKKNMILKIDSGLFDVKVIAKGSESLVVQALNDFVIGSRRHINIPGIHCDLPTVTSKDLEDIIFAIKNKFSYIALSFTRSANDIKILRKFLTKYKAEKAIKIISKIENQEGLDNIDKIIDVSNMVMVARGDLGTELPVEKIPIYQMDIVKKCKLKNTHVIVATQILESMIINSIPTRAEVSDIFYAVIEGVDYLMLSGETAVGKYPIQCVEIMKKVINQAEKI